MKAQVLEQHHARAGGVRLARPRTRRRRSRPQTRTGGPSSSASLAAIGLRLNSGFGLPLGRPRWLARITVAPWSSAYLMVGSDARMRVSSPITPFFSGTLKSTRTKTRLPLGRDP